MSNDSHSLRKGRLEKFFRPVDAASLVVFRIGFGLILFWEVCRYFSHNWIAGQYIRPEFYFPYIGFHWVQPWPGNGMYVHFAILGATALCIALGLFYVRHRGRDNGETGVRSAAGGEEHQPGGGEVDVDGIAGL